MADVVIAGYGPAGAAAGGVILACGGFEAEPALADAYLPFGPSWPVGHPGNTGAGLVMAQQAGAALWHMYGCFGWFAFRTPDYPTPFAVDFFGAAIGIHWSLGLSAAPCAWARWPPGSTPCAGARSPYQPARARVLAIVRSTRSGSRRGGRWSIPGTTVSSQPGIRAAASRLDWIRGG